MLYATRKSEWEGILTAPGVEGGTKTLVPDPTDVAAGTLKLNPPASGEFLYDPCGTPGSVFSPLSD